MAEQTQSMDFNKIADSCRNISSLSSSFESTISTSKGAVGKINGNAWEGEAANNFSSELNGLVDKLPTANQQLAYSVLYLTSVSDGYEALGDATVNKLIDLVGGQNYIDNLNVNNLPDPDLSVKKAEAKTSDTKTDTNTDTNSDTNKTYTDDGNNTDNTGNNSYSGPNGNYSNDNSNEEEVPSLAGQTIEIPSSVKQSGYTSRGYDFIINSGDAMSWPSGSAQERVANAWKNQGSKFKNGIAVLSVNGKDRYIISLTTKFGQVGDCVDVTLEDGTVIPCVIGDSKGESGGSEWGNAQSDGTVSIIEFEVQREKFIESWNPTTEKWNLEWDSSKSIKNMKNLGSILIKDTNN